MNRASAKELQLHVALLENSNDSYQKLFETYNAHLISCLFRWYKKSLYADHTLAHEAVFDTLKYYCAHPRAFNPEHGSLKKFLEIHAARSMQQIFERENHPLRNPELKYVLVRYFDNSLDIRLAKLIISNENDICTFISLLDIGNCRLEQQLHEINRHRERIGKVLDTIKASHGYLFDKTIKSHSSSAVKL